MGIEVALLASMAGMTLFSADAQAKGALAQGEYQSKMLELNAEMAEFQGEDAIRRGNKEANTYRQKVKGVVGSQRASFAAQGLDINSGSAIDIQDETRSIGETDAMTITNNAWRTAWGYKAEANNSRSSGKLNEIAAENTARTSLVTGGLQAAGYGLKAWGKEK